MTLYELEPIRKIIQEIHKKRKKISGGTGNKERYEMRNTVLYYKLGKVITDVARAAGYERETKQNFIGEVGRMLQKEFDDNESLARWSVRFFESFDDEDDFKRASKLCRDSLGQLREVIDILDKRNPFDIPSYEIESFKKEYSLLDTYEERRKRCTELKKKFAVGGTDIDFTELTESFDLMEKTVRCALDESKESRKKMRCSLGLEFIKNCRYMCMVLSREETFSSENSRKVIKQLIRSNPPKDLQYDEMAKFYLIMKKFLVLNINARNSLRKILSPYSMTLLQKMLLAIQSEDDYENYHKTGELFRSIGL